MNQQERIKKIKALSENPLIIKEAGLIGMFSEALSATFDPDDPKGSVAKIATSAALAYYFGLPWAIAGAILQYGFGIHVGTLLDTLSGAFAYVFNKNKDTKVDPDQAANEMADITIKETGIPNQKLNEPIGEAIVNSVALANNKHRNTLIKEAGAATVLAKWVAKSSKGGFIKTVLVKIFKALLAGAGIGVVGAAISRGVGLSGRTPSLFQSDDTKPSQTDSNRLVPTSKLPSSISLPGKISPVQRRSILGHTGPASGAGQTHHVNDADQNDQGREAWYMPNTSGDFGRTVWGWIWQIYPSMNRAVAATIYQNYMRAFAPINAEIKRFNIGSNINYAGALVRIPPKIGNKELHSVKDIVDLTLSSMVIR